MSMLFFRNRLCLFILPFLFLFAACNDASESAKVVRIADGDTITILHADNTQERIRLYGIDCPEKSQSFGNSARKFTGSLVFGKQASIRSMDRDKYGRTVAWVYVGEKNVNEELVRAGYAWHYRQHSNDAGLRSWNMKPVRQNGGYGQNRTRYRHGNIDKGFVIVHPNQMPRFSNQNLLWPEQKTKRHIPIPFTMEM